MRIFSKLNKLEPRLFSVEVAFALVAGFCFFEILFGSFIWLSLKGPGVPH
jgi:hypothetical protein